MLTREASMFVYADTPAFVSDPFFTRSVSANVIETLKSPLLAHDLANEAILRRDAILQLAATEELGAVDVPSRQVDPGAPTEVLVFNPRGAVRGGRQSWLFRASSLNAGLFVGRDDEVVST
jgi:hypothetical protein